MPCKDEYDLWSMLRWAWFMVYVKIYMIYVHANMNNTICDGMDEWLDQLYGGWLNLWNMHTYAVKFMRKKLWGDSIHNLGIA